MSNRSKWLGLLVLFVMLTGLVSRLRREAEATKETASFGWP